MARSAAAALTRHEPEIARDHLLGTNGHFEAAAQFRRRHREQSLAKPLRHGADDIILLFLGDRLEGLEPLLRRALPEGTDFLWAEQFVERFRVRHVGRAGRGCGVPARTKKPNEVLPTKSG